jgi:hypothetical protein
LRFNPLSDHELDVARFSTLIEACRLHLHPDPAACAESAARLTQALELVRGEFMEEFSLGDCAQFDDWLLVQRQSLQVQFTLALEQLAAFIGAGGLGEPIVSGLALNDTRTVLEGAIPSAILAFLVQFGFDRLDRLLIPKGLRLADSRKE